jgi:hypothetical protein
MHAKTETNTMQRRNLLIGMGSIAAGGAATIGTGAFTSVEANRNVTVEVAGDASAFLSIDGAKKEDGQYTPNAVEYVNNVDGSVNLDFTGDDDTGTDIGSGINDNATTIFDDLLQITNQGTQGVYVGYTAPGSKGARKLTNANFALYHEDPDYDGDETSYDIGINNYNNGGQLNIDTAQNENGDGEPDLVRLGPGETLNNIGAYFFGSPDVSTITSTPVTFVAGATFDDVPDPK